MSLLIYKNLNYEGSIKTRMTIDHGLVLNDQFFMITTMAASVLQLSHKTAKKRGYGVSIRRTDGDTAHLCGSKSLQKFF